MHETQKMLYNTQKTVLAVSDCLQALNVAQQATLEIIDHNFGQALRLIDQLQSQLLPRIEQFSFARRLHLYIPGQLATVRNYALEELKSWLGTVRDQCPRIGELAFNRAQKRIEKWQELYEGVTTPTTITGMSAEEVLLVEMEREDAATILNNQTVQVQFTPLLKALHLFELMNQRSEFQSTFAEYRRAQAKVIFDMPVRLRKSDAEAQKSFASFLHHVCGFFVLEYFIVRLPQKFYSAAHVEGLWEAAVTLINGYVMDSLGSSVTQTTFMKIKWLQVFFLQAIEVYDIYSISSMLDAILSLFYRYIDLAKTENVNKIHELATTCAITPLPVSSSNSVAKMRRSFSFLASDSSLETATTFVFSEYLPSVFSSINDFITNFYVFLEGVPQQSSELDDIAKKNCELLLEEASRAYVERAISGDTQIEELTQMIKDLECLGQVCVDVSRLLNMKRLRNRSDPVVISAKERIADYRDQLLENLKQKIQSEVSKIVSYYPYEYTPASKPSHPSNAIRGIHSTGSVGLIC